MFPSRPCPSPLEPNVSESNSSVTSRTSHASSVDLDTKAGMAAHSRRSNMEPTCNQDELDNSIRLRTKALKRRPPGHPERATSLENLAWALGRRYGRSGSLDDLEACIQLLYIDDIISCHRL